MILVMKVITWKNIHNKLLSEDCEEKTSSEKYDILSANLLDSMVEEKAKFQSSFRSGEAALDHFLNIANPMNKIAHPALPCAVKDQQEENRKRGMLFNIHNI